VNSPQKILLIRFSSLGDIIMTTAMIRCVRARFPDAQIDMVVRADFLDLIEHNPHLDNKIGLGRGEGLAGLWRLVKKLRSEKYDLIYDAHRSLRTRLMMPLLGSGAKAYYQKHYLRRSLALTFKLPLLDKKRVLERAVEPLGRWGVFYDGGGPEMRIDDKARETGLSKIPLDPGKKWVGIIPSAQWPGKRWPLPFFRTAMERLLIETPYHLVVFGGGGDHFCGELCAGLSPARVVNAQGKLSLAESAALVGECEFVIANDTGLMHVADALDIPSVLMLGPTSAELGCLPYHPRAQVLEESLWCRPCSKNGQAPCIRGKRYCLVDITPDRVVTAAQRVGEGQ